MKLLAYAAICGVLAVASARAQDVPLGCPQAGTVIKIPGGELRFSGANGAYCNFTNMRGEPASRLNIFAADGTEFGNRLGGKLGALWPLKVGAKLDLSYEARGGTWYFTFEVLRRERVTVPAGSFDSIVIAQTEKGSGENNFHGVRTYWYAPEVGYFVKFDTQIVTGHRGSREIAWEALQISKPKS
jgi:hypothetical protein